MNGNRSIFSFYRCVQRSSASAFSALLWPLQVCRQGPAEATVALLESTSPDRVYDEADRTLLTP